MPNRPTERGKSLLLQKEMNQKHCNAKTSTLNGSALSTKCRKYEKVKIFNNNYYHRARHVFYSRITFGGNTLSVHTLLDP